MSQPSKYILKTIKRTAVLAWEPVYNNIVSFFSFFFFSISISHNICSLSHLLHKELKTSCSK